MAIDSGNKNKKLQLDWLHNCKSHIAMYRKIKVIRGKYSKRGSASIGIPTAWPPAHSDPPTLHPLPDPQKATDWCTVDLPDEIVYNLLTHNRLHFGQAHGTPFTQPEFTHHLDWAVSTETADLILIGNFDSSKLSDIQALLMKHCTKENSTTLPLYITESKFISKI
jgi:hypothetical protein